MKQWRGFAVVATVLIVGAGIAAAQDVTVPARPGMNVIDAALEAAAAETGLTVEEVRAQLGEGVTLAEIIEANDGDTQAVIDAAVAAANAEIDTALDAETITEARAESLRDRLESAITGAVNGDLRIQQFRRGFGRGGERGFGFGGRGFGLRGAHFGVPALTDAILESTDLTVEDVAEGLRSGSTLAELIAAAGGDVEAVVDATVQQITAEVEAAVENGRLTQEEADERIAALEERVREALTTSPMEQRIARQVAASALRDAAELTGLEPREIVEQLQAGTPLADILTASGADVDAFIEGLVAGADARLNVLVVDGVITEARAAELLAQFRTDIEERVRTGTPVSIDV